MGSFVIRVVTVACILVGGWQATVARAQPESCEVGRAGCFLDRDGEWRSQRLWQERMRLDRDPDYLRTFVEMLVFVGAGTTWYWIERDRNARDWDFEGILQRFDKDSFRYDNNAIDVNFLYHSFSGASYYGFSRVNDLGVPASFASAFLASWVWEYLIEFKERVSVNDTLVTPAAGLVFGEFFHRLGRYLAWVPGGGNRRQRALRWSFGAPQAVHDWMDGKKPPPAGARADEAGFHPDIAAAFRFAYGASLARPGRGNDFVLHELGFDGALVALPGYLRAGDFGAFFGDANFTSLRFRAWLAAEGTGVELAGDTTVLGYHRQHIVGSPDRRRGGAATIGTSLTYLYRRQTFDDFDDRLAVLGLPGLALDGHLFAGPVTMRLGTRLHGEFAGVHSQAFPAWEEANPDERPKTILLREQYYYGWGGSARIYGELSVPTLRVGGSLRLGRWSSREGLDRSQEAVTADVRASDRLVQWGVWARWMPLEGRGLGLYLEASHEGQKRWSRVESFTARQQLHRYHLSLGWQL